MKEEIRITIDKSAKLVLNVHGIPGAQCISVTKAFEREMGELLDRSKTREFYSPVQIKIKNRVRNDLGAD